MKKGAHLVPDKSQEPKAGVKSLTQIKFNISPSILACFKNSKQDPPSQCARDSAKETKNSSQLKSNTSQDSLELQSQERARAISCCSSFDEKVVFMQYDNMDVYIDNSTRKKSTSRGSKDSRKRGRNEDCDDGGQDEFINSCVKAVTEETDNTSKQESLYNYYLASGTSTPHSSQMGAPEINPGYMMYSYQTASRAPRNRRSVTIEESRAFVIEYHSIDADGRTTVMVKNIPNKYTQEELLEQFMVNYENQFDFFYLPIDKDNDCNMGYAFVNFVSTGALKDFYAQFHKQIWKKYKSPKICHISYARCQGTLQLADHFKHSKIINQKERKFKPLIGINEASKRRDLREIIKNQRGQE